MECCDGRQGYGPGQWEGEGKKGTVLCTQGVKAPRSLDSTTCTKLNLSGKYQTSREALVLLETTQSLLVREEVTLGSFQEHWIGNQVKLRA